MDTPFNNLFMVRVRVRAMRSHDITLSMPAAAPIKLQTAMGQFSSPPKTESYLTLSTPSSPFESPIKKFAPKTIHSHLKVR